MSKLFLRQDFDVIIVGAGMAGLTAAERLSGSSLRIAVFDGRDRIGGRVFSSLEGKVPIELGAEFIHSRPPEILSLTKQLKISTFDIRGHTYQAAHNMPLKVVPNLFEEMEQLLIQARNSGPDKPFSDAITKLSKNDVEYEVIERFKQFLETYNAADMRKTSAKFLTLSDDEFNNTKLEARYDRLVKHILKTTKQNAGRNFRLYLKHIVKRVSWNKGSVSITVLDSNTKAIKKFHAPKIVITIPLSLLKKGTKSTAKIKFQPALTQKQKFLDLMEFGDVEKIILRFHKKFWPSNMSTMYSRHTPIQHWVTTTPKRSSLITGWVGGPKAKLIKHLTHKKILGLALNSLSQIFSLPQGVLRENLKSWHFHHWANDPFACGAYSYLKPGGTNAPKLLAKPIQNTLFFAGEATDVNGDIATVHGAMTSGLRVANEILS